MADHESGEHLSIAVEAEPGLDDAPPPYLRLLWPVYLFFRPRTYFQHYVVSHTPALTAFFCWTYGIAVVIDHLDRRTLTGRSAVASDDWNTRWVYVAVVGAVSGLFAYLLGGWWYRVRLRWSGAIDPEPYLVRRIYIFASQIIALPTIVLEVIERGRFPTPSAAAEGADWWLYVAFLVFPFWSVWVSYCGARTAYELRRAASLFWFLILPAAFYALLIGGGVYLAYQGVNPEPETDRPNMHNSATFAFQYPRNWSIDSADEDYDADSFVTVDTPQFAWITIQVVAGGGTPDETHFDHVPESYGATFREIRPIGEFRTWGRFKGVGRGFEMQHGETTLRLRAFAAVRGAEGYFEVLEFCDVDALDRLGPGLRLIEETLYFKPPKQ